jgi:hypothetical protein
MISPPPFFASKRFGVGFVPWVAATRGRRFGGMQRLEIWFVATVFRLLARALAERLFESGRTVILLQDIGERFVGKLLNVLRRVPREQVKRVPRLGIECDQLAFIGRVNGGLPCRPTAVEGWNSGSSSSSSSSSSMTA